MEIKTGTRRNTLTLTDVTLEGKNFGGNTGLWWDKFNDGTRRKIAIRLTKEEADWFAQQGGKVRVMEANEKFPEPKYFIEVNISYRNKKPPLPGQAWNVFENGPRIVMVIPGGKNTELTEDTVANLDRCYITKIDMEVNCGPARLKDGTVIQRNGVPGITLYADRIFATVKRNELDARYEDIPAEHAIADQEDYEEYLKWKAMRDAGGNVPF